MADYLHYDTVIPLLKKVLKELMLAEVFQPFRLVGGTALSLQIGHRESVDIDLFTDVPYGSIDFEEIEKFLCASYDYVETNKYEGPAGMGKSFYVGNSEEESVKLDVFYTTDNFIRPIEEVDSIRMATVEDIIAMKMEVIQYGGRKKDFWDLHELIGQYSFDDMLGLHKERYEYGHDPKKIRKNFGAFDRADEDLTPKCFKQKSWELIKLDMLEFAGLE